MSYNVISLKEIKSKRKSATPKSSKSFVKDLLQVRNTKHVLINTCIHTSIQKNLYTCTYTFMHTCIHICIHTYLHTMQTHIHTYRYIDTITSI
jgi:hypothetical protein